MLGIADYDGAGTVHYSVENNVGGTLTHADLSGTYTIEANCAGIQSLTADTGEVYHYALQVVLSGAGVQLVTQDADVVATGTEQLLPNGGCDQATLSGPYGLLSSASVYVGAGGPTRTPMPVVTLSEDIFDGAGAITEDRVVNFNGRARRLMFSGTYTVNPDCSGSLELALPTGESQPAAFVILGGGQELRLTAVETVAVASSVAERR